MESIRVMLVDDDAAYADVVRHRLRPFQNREFEVTWLNVGQKAIEMLGTPPGFHLVLMDYFLSSGNGVELAKQISSAHPGVPIILLTSSKDFHVAIEAMKYGVEEYLVKDEAIDAVLPRVILNVLDRVRLRTQIAEVQRKQEAAEAVKELVVTMCHEFNNPLAAIKISTDILLRQAESREERELLTKLNGNIARLEKQIVKLRDLNLEKH